MSSSSDLRNLLFSSADRAIRIDGRSDLKKFLPDYVKVMPTKLSMFMKH
jgi:hypothetical protein